MKKRMIRTVAVLLAIGSSASGAIITSSASAPAGGDYASDASATTESSQFQFAPSRDDMGQSFTLGTAGQDAYYLDSVTLKIRDRGRVDESSTGITLSFYEGGTVSSNLLSSVTFTTPTFDTSANNYVTFALTSAERLALGQLSAGSEYTWAFTTTNATHGFRPWRSNDGDVAYAGGNAFWDERVLNGNGDGDLDWVFQVNASVIPEPATLGLLGVFGGCILFIRRRFML